MTGSWNTAYSNGSSDGGTLTGFVQERFIRFKFATSDPRCRYHAVAKITSTGLQGNMINSPHCPQNDGGSFVVDIQ